MCWRTHPPDAEDYARGRVAGDAFPMSAHARTASCVATHTCPALWSYVAYGQVLSISIQTIATSRSLPVPMHFLEFTPVPSLRRHLLPGTPAFSMRRPHLLELTAS